MITRVGRHETDYVRNNFAFFSCHFAAVTGFGQLETWHFVIFGLDDGFDCSVEMEHQTDQPQMIEKDGKPQKSFESRKVVGAWFLAECLSMTSSAGAIVKL